MNELEVMQSQDKAVDGGPVCPIEMFGLYPQINRVFDRYSAANGND